MEFSTEFQDGWLVRQKGTKWDKVGWLVDQKGTSDFSVNNLGNYTLFPELCFLLENFECDLYPNWLQYE